MFSVVRPLLFGGIAGKVLGILRELISAAMFGTGMTASAYRLSQAAFLIPFQGFLSDGLTSGFTPTYARQLGGNPLQAHALFATMHALILAASCTVCVLVISFAQSWVHILAPGFDRTTAELATEMLQILALAIPMYAVTSLYAAADLAAGRAAKTAARASFQSVGLIAGTTLAFVLNRPLYIPAGFVGSYFILTIWGATSAVRNGQQLWPGAGKWRLAALPLSSVWSAYRILILIPAILQLHFIIERRAASVASAHAVAALDYAKFVADTAVLLLAVPFGLAGLATMAVASAEESRAAAWKSIRLLLYVGVPVSVIFCLHAAWAVHVTYGRGAFDFDSVKDTTAILQTLAAGIWAQLIGHAGVRFLSALGRNRRVLVVYIVGVSTNIVLNLSLSSIGTAGLGIAATANSIVVAIMAVTSLGLAGRLLTDIGFLAIAVAGYVCVWQFVPQDLRGMSWTPPLIFCAYWGLVFTFIPHSRRAVGESLRLVRLAR